LALSATEYWRRFQ